MGGNEGTTVTFSWVRFYNFPLLKKVRRSTLCSVESGVAVVDYLVVVAGMLMESARRVAFVTCRCCARKDWPGGTREEARPPRRDSMANF